MVNAFFLHRIKHNKNSGLWDKGIEVKDSENEDNFAKAKQAYHAYLGAYAYGQNADTDFVSCHITDINGGVIMEETWEAPEEPEEPAEE